MACEAQKRAQPKIPLQNADLLQPPKVQQTSFEEHHYTVIEIAAMWNLSKDSVRRIFQNEPGVLVLGDRPNGRKRRYTMLRIPRSVLERVHQRCSLVSYQIMT